jgi:hypothetical protein
MLRTTTPKISKFRGISLSFVQFRQLVEQFLSVDFASAQLLDQCGYCRGFRGLGCGCRLFTTTGHAKYIVTSAKCEGEGCEKHRKLKFERWGAIPKGMGTAQEFANFRGSSTTTHKVWTLAIGGVWEHLGSGSPQPAAVLNRSWLIL